MNFFTEYFKLKRAFINLKVDNKRQIIAHTTKKVAFDARGDKIRELQSIIANQKEELRNLNKERTSCRKILLFSNEEAEEFARIVTRRTNEFMEPYKCIECSNRRNKLVFHITHVFKLERGKFKNALG